MLRTTVLAAAVTVTVACGSVTGSADGFVRWEDYERAVFETIRCINEEGLITEGPELSQNRVTLTFSIVTPPGEMTPEHSARINAVFQQCAKEYLEDVEWAYLQQSAPTGAERAELIEEFAECVSQGLGSDIPAGMTPNEIAALASESRNPDALVCLPRYESLFIQLTGTDDS